MKSGMSLVNVLNGTKTVHECPMSNKYIELMKVWHRSSWLTSVFRLFGSMDLLQNMMWPFREETVTVTTIWCIVFCDPNPHIFSSLSKLGVWVLIHRTVRHCAASFLDFSQMTSLFEAEKHVLWWIKPWTAHETAENTGPGTKHGRLSMEKQI